MRCSSQECATVVLGVNRLLGKIGNKRTGQLVGKLHRPPMKRQAGVFVKISRKRRKEHRAT